MDDNPFPIDDVPAPGAAPDDRALQIQDLIQTIKESADKLAADGSSRGDLKLISRTLRELRYAFKVFSPYRKHRKVTVFGSARTLPEEPAYRSAVDFGHAMADQNWLVVTGDEMVSFGLPTLSGWFDAMATTWRVCTNPCGRAATCVTTGAPR